MKKISCLGILVMDVLSGPLSSYPIPGRKTQVISENIKFMPGGGAANSSSALGQMGLDVSVFSKVGNDPNGIFIINELKRNNVNTDGIVISDTDVTPFTFVGIHKNGDRTFIHTPGANKTFRLEDMGNEKILGSDILLYQDLWVLPLIDGKPGAELLKEAKSGGATTILDECWGLGPDRRIFEEMLPYLDYVLPSLDDMRVIYPGRTASEIAGHIISLGCKNVVLKMGADGCLLVNGKETFTIPSAVKKIVDTTGAGDCWDAGFIAGIANGLSFKDAAETGTATAAICIENIGGAVGIPPYEEIISEM
ncbi:MAG: putative sugar kinase YdjH [Smithella sp. PtaU1.Bin162]|nr:MAG: putative sugar kinase YdjH [Smithella sp. PtaU1.Bin162]